MTWFDRLIELAFRIWDRAERPKKEVPYEPPANPRDVAIAVSSYDAAKKSSEAAEKGGKK